MSRGITLEKFKPHGSTGPETEDMFWKEHITGPQGARYELFVETHHSKADIKKAEAYLKRSFDVVKIYLIYEKK